MATASVATPIFSTPSSADGVKQHLFTVAEYHRMGEAAVFHEDDPIELLEGRLFIKLDNGPPYEVPLGIPPESIAGSDVLRFPQRKFTVREYHRLVESGALSPTLRTELIEGWVVEKMTRNAPHDAALDRTAESLQTRLPAGWRARGQSAIACDEAEPEPDISVVPGPRGRFDKAKPRPHEVALVVEISESTLALDHGPKMRDYAKNSIAQYWIVNLVDRIVEVHENPTGPVAIPQYRAKQIFRSGDVIPLLIADVTLNPIPVDDLLPTV